MRKSTLLLAVLLAASVATTADAKTKKKPMAAPAPMPAYTMDQSALFMHDAMMPTMAKPAVATMPAKKMRMAKKKKMKMKMKKA